jgi:hypothetical protein
MCHSILCCKNNVFSPGIQKPLPVVEEQVFYRPDLPQGYRWPASPGAFLFAGYWWFSTSCLLLSAEKQDKPGWQL